MVRRHAGAVRELPPCGVGELMAVIERLAAVVGTDSGPKHLAAALGVPTFTWYGPTHPDTWSPPGAHARLVVDAAAVPGLRSDALSALELHAGPRGGPAPRGGCWNTWSVMNEPLPISVLLLARDETAELSALLPALGVRARTRGGVGSARRAARLARRPSAWARAC